MPSYKTVKLKSSGEFTEKRSRFIGYCCPVKTVDEANSFIAEIKQKHWDAKHNVYAYILRDGNIKKYSDDGEPQGTAGVPVLDVLEKSGVCNVCVVATRYFGGILLGGGGLVRAYSHTAKVALDAGKITEMALCYECVINVDYNFYGKLSSVIPENGGVVTDTQFSNDVAVSFYIEAEKSEKLFAMLVDLSNGRYCAQKTGEKFAEIKE